mgnify:CR=1 FL=1
MPINNEKPHRRLGPGYGIAFWNSDNASNEEEATRAVVYTGPPGMPYPEFNFALPAERHEMERLERALAKAYATKSSLTHWPRISSSKGKGIGPDGKRIRSRYK